jgi:hypothetical protein
MAVMLIKVNLIFFIFISFSYNELSNSVFVTFHGYVIPLCLAVSINQAFQNLGTILLVSKHTRDDT